MGPKKKPSKAAGPSAPSVPPTLPAPPVFAPPAPSTTHALAVPAPYEFQNRPVFHRTFGPNQPSLFLPLSDARYSLHILDDISYIGFHIAAHLPEGEWIIRRSHTDPLESNFTRNGAAMRLRNNAHFGSGLRTPDGLLFVRISTLAGKTLGNQVRTFYGVGAVRANNAHYETITEEWDHKAWQLKYKELYDVWLKRLFWPTDENDTPLLPEDKRGRLPEREGGGVLRVGRKQDLPPGWLYRLHRDEKAGVEAYKQNKVNKEDGYLIERPSGKKKDWLPAHAARKSKPRETRVPGTPPWLLAGLHHSEYPNNPTAYLSPADPNLPSFTGPSPNDARNPVAGKPSRDWCKTLLRSFSEKRYGHMDHLKLPKRVKRKRVVVESPSDSGESESEASDAADASGVDQPPAKKAKKDLSSGAGGVAGSGGTGDAAVGGDSSGDDLPLIERHLLRQMAQLSRAQIFSVLAKHAAKVGNFYEELVEQRLAVFDVPQLEALERSVQSRLDDLTVSQASGVGLLHEMRLQHAQQGLDPAEANPQPLPIMDDPVNYDLDDVVDMVPATPRAEPSSECSSLSYDPRSGSTDPPYDPRTDPLHSEYEPRADPSHHSYDPRCDRNRPDWHRFHDPSFEDYDPLSDDTLPDWDHTKDPRYRDALAVQAEHNLNSDFMEEPSEAEDESTEVAEPADKPTSGDFDESDMGFDDSGEHINGSAMDLPINEDGQQAVPLPAPDVSVSGVVESVMPAGAPDVLGVGGVPLSPRAKSPPMDPNDCVMIVQLGKRAGEACQRAVMAGSVYCRMHHKIDKKRRGAAEV